MGEGKINPFIIPNKWKTSDVCKEIYNNINTKISIDRVILTAHNKDTKIINNKVFKLLNEVSYIL